MAKVLIVADDYTGANDTAITIRECGYDVFTVIDASEADQKTVDDVFCLAVPTDSRAIPADEARERVYRETKHFGGKDTGLYSKRIDSTLRGNLGAELDGMLDALEDDRMAVIVPGFIEAGRVYKEGLLYLFGEPVHTTKQAQDVKTPVRTSSAYEIIKNQSKREIREIRTKEYTDQIDLLAESLKKQYAEGVRGFVFDCAEISDRNTIADAVLQSGLPFIVMDPGPFSKVMTEKIYGAASEQEVPVLSQEGKHTVLFSIGSTNPVLYQQLLLLCEKENIKGVTLDMEKVLSGEEACEEAICEAYDQAVEKKDRVIVLQTSGLMEGEPVDLKKYDDQEKASKKMNDAIADLTIRLLKNREDIGGAVMSGGDTSIRICQKMGAFGEYPLMAVEPLTVYGILQGGSMSGLPIITKGGMIGKEDTLVNAMEYLFAHM